MDPNKPQVSNSMEYRLIDLDTIEVEEREAEGKSERVVTGYAAMFEKLSLDLGGFKEKIAPGAFADSVDRDIVALWSHDTNIILGRSSNKTLSLEEDDKGLKIRLSLDSDQWGEYAYKKIKRRDVKGMSFGFRVPPGGDEWDYTEKKEYIRTLRKISLFEVSPTAFPAYPQTAISARSVEEAFRAAREKFEPTLEEVKPRLSVSHRGRILRLIEACAGRVL